MELVLVVVDVEDNDPTILFVEVEVAEPEEACKLFGGNKIYTCLPVRALQIPLLDSWALG